MEVCVFVVYTYLLALRTRHSSTAIIGLAMNETMRIATHNAIPLYKERMHRRILADRA